MLRNNNFEEINANLVDEFKRLSSLHRDDKQAFELESRRAIEKRINALGHGDGGRRRLEALQNRLNSVISSDA